MMRILVISILSVLLASCSGSSRLEDIVPDWANTPLPRPARSRHRDAGQPIQPLSTVHGANYADYSHGIRLVSRWALIDGKLRLIRDLLQDPATARVLSDEGPILLDWSSLAARN